MKTILKLLAAPLLLLCVLVQAQVKTNFNNKTFINERGHFSKSYKATIDFEIPSKNITNLLQVEKRKTGTIQETKPFQIAVPVPVNLDIAKLMNWDDEGDSAYGKFTIKVNGALSSSINFDKFYLPNGTEMYIYNENGKMITGPITEKENNPDKTWGSWVYQGPRLTIEVKTPLSTLKQLMLHANNIAYGYKEVYVSGFGQSAPCEINVLCPLGNGWQNERNSVALGISGDGTVVFSGSMIMNTCNTDRPFFLTANHVYEEATPVRNVTGWRFTFQAWSPTCTPSQNSDGVTYNGSTFRANYSGSDFCLVELNSTPPANSGINYSGWSRANVASPSGVSISHPMGDVMKIASFNQPPTQQTFLGSNDWNVVWANGTVEPGSSGGPLYNNDHRIVGQVHGGSPSTICNVNDNAFFGRFDLSWTGGGTNSTRLSNWLDPAGTGAMTTNTTNISALIPTNFSISGDASFCTTSNSYTIPQLPAGAAVHWDVTPAGIATANSQNSTQTTLTRNDDGIVTLTATISNVCGSPIIVTKENITVGIPTFGIIADVPCQPGRIVQLSTFTVSPVSSVPTTYHWRSVQNGTSTTIIGTGPTVSKKFPLGGLYQVYAWGQNACGFGDEAVVNFQVVSCPNSLQDSITMMVSPNPATNTLTVEVNKKNERTTEPAHIVMLELVDKMGNPRLRKQIGQGINKISLDVSQVPNGIYILRVFDGIKWTSYKIMIQH